MTDWELPVQFLKGVGPVVAKQLGTFGIRTLFDLIFYFPRSYEDRRNIPSILENIRTLKNPALIKGVITGKKLIKTRHSSLLKVNLKDQSGEMTALFFNQPFLEKKMNPGVSLFVSGTIETNLVGSELKVQNYEFLNTKSFAVGRVMPVYGLTQGLNQKKMQILLWDVVHNHLAQLPEIFPPQDLTAFGFVNRQTAVSEMHFPSSREAWKKARDRLAFEELFYLQYQVILQKKSSGENLPAVSMKTQTGAYLEKLPYQLTGAQQKVMNEIAKDMSQSSPMNRLVQGDVGAGKTEVALFSALIAIENGFQVVLMAPTEILATQHYEKLTKRLESLGKTSGFLAGKIKGKAREKVLKELAEGKIDLLIGTHAVFQDEIKIKKLGLVIIDEQHRFGVNQRDRLRHTGQQSEVPHLLVLSATPIPRSLSLTLYGHLNISILDELPPGRKPIQTIFYEEKNRMQAYMVAKSQLQKKSQVYAVFPLIEESEVSPLKAATIEKEKIQNLFPEYKVGLIHGQMKPAQKTEIMQQFRNKEFDLLVATTVIEVGVDVPAATVMIIENAQRYGLSQLHQLRGRVGRGSDQSFCLLIGKTSTPESKKRLQAMVETTDGFKLAELDLQLRGSGDLIGTRQSGLPDLMVADLIKDLPLVEKAKSYVEKILENDAIHQQPAYQLLLREINRKKNREFLRAQLN